MKAIYFIYFPEDDIVKIGKTENLICDVNPGWIFHIRNALDMTLKDLAKRVGLAVSTVAQMEKREEVGRITINNLRKIGKAMECELIHALIPKGDTSTIIKTQATKKAKEIIERADTHMMLENQQVTTPIEERIERLAERLIKEKRVW